MAECVSCGRDIPAGKFFCDACYVRMKGHMGSLKGVPQASGEAQQAAGAGGDAAAEAAAPEVGLAASAGKKAEKKGNGALTPTSVKKVIYMDRLIEKTPREKTSEKRFTVTISFSERTYAALARLKLRKRDRSTAVEVQAGVGEALPDVTRVSRRKGKHSKARLRAVSSSSSRARKPNSGFSRLIAKRDRAMDRGDFVAIAMAAFATLAVVVLSFMPWAEVSWSPGEGEAIQTYRVAGVDLGAMTYICIALAVGAMLYMFATWMFDGPLDRLDYGVIFIVAGVLFIPIFYATIASNARFLNAAYRQAGGSGSPVTVAYERQTLWTAYAMVFAGALLAFAGLLRMAEHRKAGTRSTEGSE